MPSFDDIGGLVNALVSAIVMIEQNTNLLGDGVHCRAGMCSLCLG